MSFDYRAAFSRLLDWQTYTEEWSIPISGVGGLRDSRGYNLRDGDILDPQQLIFPTNHPVDVEIRGNRFIARPRERRWLGKITWLFEGESKVQDNALCIVGTYKVSNKVRKFQTLWSGFVIVFILLSLLPVLILLASAAVGGGQNSGDLVSDLLDGLYSVGFGVAMLIFVRFIYLRNLKETISSYAKLQAFLQDISVHQS